MALTYFCNIASYRKHIWFAYVLKMEAFPFGTKLIRLYRMLILFKVRPVMIAVKKKTSNGGNSFLLLYLGRMVVMRDLFVQVLIHAITSSILE